MVSVWEWWWSLWALLERPSLCYLVGVNFRLENFQFSEVKLVDPPLQMAPSLELEPGRAEEIMEVDEEVTGVEDDNVRLHFVF